MQATPGTPLTPDEADAGRPSAPRHTALTLGIALVAIVVDAITKVLAVAHLEGKPSRPLLGDLLQLTFTRNPGAAFSTGESLTPVIAVVAAIAACVAVWFSLRVRSTGWAWAIGLVLAGIVGNLVDRIFREPSPLHGHVVDFLQLPHWPIFNVADMCINVGAVLIVLQTLRGVRLDGTRQEA